MREKLLAKLFFKFNLETASALSVGGLDSFNTDHDVIVNAEDMPYVPASSIAGSIFSGLSTIDEITSYLKFYSIHRGNLKKNSNEISNSAIFISDGMFDKRPSITVRDGIALDYDTKQTKDSAKFDYEVIPNGTKWSFYTEVTIRENNVIDTLDNTIN